jgi:hypothetical protein
VLKEAADSELVRAIRAAASPGARPGA